MRWCAARRPKTWDKLARRREMPLAICTALTDRDAHVRIRAAVALVRIDPAEACAMPTLLDALKDEKAAVRRAAVSALADLTSPTGSVIAALLRTLKEDRDKRVRTGAAFGARTDCRTGQGHRQSPGGVDHRTDKGGARRQGQHRPRVLHQGFAELWAGCARSDSHPDGPHKGTTGDRNIAFEILTQMGPVAVPALIEALKESRDRFRLDLMYCLEEIGPAAKEAVPLLRRSLESDDARERTAAVAALMRVAWKSEAPRVTVVLRQLIDSDRLCGAADQRSATVFRGTRCRR